MQTKTLKVPGATLHYEVRGSGPVLLLICGGIYDAAGYAGLAGELADRYTVVTYDRRGNSRSPLDGPPGPLRIDEQADDAHRLLQAVTSEPAAVFGNSSGADIALELAVRHSEQVRVVVAHEPPIFDLLPDRDKFDAVWADVEAAYRSGGVEPAMAAFGAGLQMSAGESPAGEPTPEMLEMFGRFQLNMEVFVRDEVGPIAGYCPDLDVLRASSVRIVPGAGEASAGEPPHRAAVALAERLGTTTVLFPGGHGGFGDPGFGARLATVL
jgi:pimeloyl-ACP methyl ester carboxylesterase